MGLGIGDIYVERADGAGKPAGAAGSPLRKAVDLFRAGRTEAAAELIETVDRSTLRGIARDHHDTIYLATRALGLGDTADLLARLPDIPDTVRPDLRYRALLNHDCTAEAARFRRRAGGDVSATVHTDWAWSLALRALHRQHMRAGFAFYHNRFNAINKVAGAPTDVLSHVPLTDRVCDTVFLEQGLGDSAYHLALIKALRGDRPLRVVADARWLPLIRRLFPDWAAVTTDQIADQGPIPANASGDFMGLARAQQGHGRPVVRLMEPVRARPLRFGILWRGGSHQNRVEERQLPLRDFLRLLPDGHRYLSLQHDLTEEERRLIVRDPRVDLPAFDLRGDLESLFETIAALAGVIGVDGSAIHIAGCCGVPTHVLMNPRSHWYWGRSGRVDTLYPDSVTVPIGAPDRGALAQWCADRVEPWEGRLRPAPALPGPAFKRPVLVTGVPRSGTSLTMGLLGRAGLWTGPTVPGGAANPTGFFENTRLREGLTKPLLRQIMGADPLGVQTLPEPGQDYSATHWARLVARGIGDDGYDGRLPWGLKDAKLTLIWQLWAEAFPDAHWVIVTRDRDAVVNSCLRTSFMRHHSEDPAFWRLFHDAYRGRQAALARGVKGPVHQVRFEDLLAGDFRALSPVVEALDLDWSDEAARSFML